MELKVITRPYEKGDEKEIVNVLNQSFGLWPNFSISCSSLEHWIWKYLENPLNKHYTVVSLVNGRIIGANHAYPLRLQIDNTDHLVTFGSDVAVIPELRQRGIRNQMLELKVDLRRKDNVKMTLSVTSNPIIIQSYMRSRTHNRFPYRIQNLVWIKDIDFHLTNIPVRNPRLIKAGFKLTKAFNSLRNKSRQKPQLKTLVKTRKINSFNEKINSFWNQISKHYKFIIERRMEYLNWRYCHPHAGDFIVKLAEGSEGRIFGYYVVKINKNIENYPIGYIVDLLTLPNCTEIAHLMIKDAINYFEEKNVNIINCLAVKSHPLTEILKTHNFLYSQFDLQLFINEHCPMEELEKLEMIPKENVFFSYGDIDSLPTTMPKY